MKLYGMGKSRSFRALWALEESKLDYEYVVVKFGSKEENGASSVDYRNLNSQGKVPTLVDDDLVVTECGAIMNYVANLSPDTNLIPADNARLRARYDEICFFVLSDLEQGLWTSGKHRFALPEALRVPEIKPTAIWEFNKAIKALQNLFDGNGFVVGDSFTMADILLAHTITWALTAKFEVPAEFVAYRERMYQRAACLSAITKAENSN